MDQWEDLDLIEPAYITFIGKDAGELVFAAVEADLEVRYRSRDGAACAEFSWEGSDDNSHASRRGWAALSPSSEHIFIHKATTQALLPSATDFFNSLLGAFPAVRRARAHW